jgi:transposase
MSLHLAEIGRRVAPGAHAALVIDGAGYHVAARLAVPRNITLVRLPPYAPELNPVENVWEYRTRAVRLAASGSYRCISKECAHGSRSELRLGFVSALLALLWRAR